MAAVDVVLSEIGATELPRLLVFNKIDRIDVEERKRLANRHPDGVLVSAATGEGIDALLQTTGRRGHADESDDDGTAAVFSR
jgi:GTPase